jgi:hypothetical protein
MSLPAVFWILVVASAVLALVALLRRRPAAFIFAASQTMILRALLRFSQEGRLDTLTYTPRWVFSTDVLTTAASILAISVAMSAVFLALPSRPSRLDPLTLPALPRWALWVLAAYFVLVIVSQRWIFSMGYSEGQQVASTPIGGVQTIMSSLLLYEVCRRVWIGSWGVPRGLLVVGGVFVMTDYLRGATGIATGYILVAAILLWQQGQTRLRTALRVVSMVALVSAFAMMVRMTRIDVSSRGMLAVENAADTIFGGDGAGVDEGSSAPQFATHVLECITLYDGGHSREWRSLTDPVIFTFEPAFLTEPLGIERPISAPWELGNYFIQLGGISIFGEAYWNGGYLGVFVFLGLVLGLCYFCDSRYRSSFTWLVILLNVGPVLLAGVNYGFSYEFRALVNALIQLAMFRFLLPRIAPQAHAEPPAAPPLREPKRLPAPVEA